MLFQHWLSMLHVPLYCTIIQRKNEPRPHRYLMNGKQEITFSLLLQHNSKALIMPARGQMVG